VVICAAWLISDVGQARSSRANMVALFLRIFPLVVMVAPTAAAERSNAERLLAASHVALVTIRDEVEGADGWRDVAVRVDKRVKGEWTSTVSMWIPQGTALSQGSKLVLFCSENATRYRGFRLYAYWEDVVRIQESSAKDFVTILTQLAEGQRTELRAAFAATMRIGGPVGEVPKVLALLFHEDTQREGLNRLLALPKEADREIAMHVYDTRPIPRALFSPDDPIVFHSSPVADCQSIQDVVVWVLGLRTMRSFGAMSEASPEKRTSISDAWFYSLIVQSGSKSTP
jgi:hypothetical protein